MGWTLVITFAAWTLPPMRIRLELAVLSVEPSACAFSALGWPRYSTSTVSVKTPICSLAFSARSRPGSNTTCGARYVANPGLSTFISYSPAGKALKTKLPSASEVVISTVFALWLVMTMVAFGTVASLISKIVPANFQEPVVAGDVREFVGEDDAAAVFGPIGSV